MIPAEIWNRAAEVLEDGGGRATGRTRSARRRFLLGLTFLVFCVAGVGLGVAWRWSERAFRAPIMVPLMLAPRDSVTRIIEVPIAARYALKLATSRDGFPVGEERALLADSPSDGIGTPLTVRWTLRDAQGVPIAHGDRLYAPVEITGGEVDRRIGEFVLLPGHYLFHIDVEARAPRMQGRLVIVRTSMAVKSGETGATGMAMLMRLFRWPLAALLCIALVWTGMLFVEAMRGTTETPRPGSRGQSR